MVKCFVCDKNCFSKSKDLPLCKGCGWQVKHFFVPAEKWNKNEWKETINYAKERIRNYERYEVK